MLDGWLMMLVGDEYVYYECMMYLVVFVYLLLKKVFVFGGGDGGVVC